MEFHARIDSSVPDLVILDPTRLRQVICNLTSNAIKFCERGAITIDVRQIHNEDHSGHYLEVQVADEGIGIPHEAMATLFKRFHQADSSISRRYGGTGLGLSISRALVKLMGGDISVTSVPNEGSTFSFTVTAETAANPIARKSLAQTLCYLGTNQKTRTCLAQFAQRKGVALVKPVQATADTVCLAEETVSVPAGAALTLLGRDLPIPLVYAELSALLGDATQEPSPHTQSINTPLHGRTILVAEDNQTNQLVVGKMLKNWGAEVVFATNGMEAVQVTTHRQDLDLILMDCEMPDMDGYAATEAIRDSVSGNANTLIIALTAHALDEFKQRALRSGKPGWQRV